MPALGMAQETGRLLKWYKAAGEQVTKGEPLMEVETDKVTVTIEAADSGTLANVVATEGQDVPVGETIAHLLAPGEAAPPPPVIRSAAPSAPAAPAGKPAAARPQASQPRQPPAQPIAPSGNGRAVVVNASPVALRMAAENGIDLALVKPGGGRVTREDVQAYLQQRQRPPAAGPGGRVLASPKARRLAGEAGLDLASIPGSGPEGAVLVMDLPLAAAGPQTPPPLPAGMSEVSLGSLWRVMAEHVTQSWQDVPHFYLVREVDAGALMAARQKLKGQGESKVTFTDMLVKLVAKTLKQHPNVNATWMRGTLALIEDINVGLAVGVPDGLVVPVVHKADQLSVQDIAQRRGEIVERANQKALGPQDIQGGTFTISNLGMYNIDAFNAIVNAPQAAILAVGRIVERVVAQEGKPVVRPILTMTLSCDHRVVDGLRGAEFLDTLAKLIEDPSLD